MPPDNDSVIRGLRGGRPRREPPTRRAPTSAPVPPALAATPPPRPATTPTEAATTDDHKPDPAPFPTTDAPKPAGATNGAVPQRTRTLLVPLDDPTTNYAVRVRRTLDELLSMRLGQLRADGVRSSKVELTEMLLWELADAKPSTLAERLARFRRAAPR